MALYKNICMVALLSIFSNCSSDVSENFSQNNLKGGTHNKNYEILEPCRSDDISSIEDLDNYILNLINLIDDTASKEFSDFSSFKDGVSSIPNRSGFIGLKSLCLLERVLLADDSIVISRNYICSKCAFFNKSIDISTYLQPGVLWDIKSHYIAWYSETKNLGWNERKRVWKNRYSSLVPISAMN